MLAVKKGRAEVVKAMMEGKPELVSSKLGSGSTVIHWALEECRCSAFFKVFIYLDVIIDTVIKIENIRYLVICVGTQTSSLLSVIAKISSIQFCLAASEHTSAFCKSLMAIA